MVRCWRGYLSGLRYRLAYAQLMPLPLTVSCFSKIQIGFIFLVLAHRGSPGKGPLNWCVCVCVCYRRLHFGRHAHVPVASWQCSSSASLSRLARARLYHVTSGCGMPNTLHVSATSRPSSTATSPTLDSRSLIDGGTAVTDTPRYS